MGKRAAVAGSAAAAVALLQRGQHRLMDTDMDGDVTPRAPVMD
jgi:hypothetical protein